MKCTQACSTFTTPLLFNTFCHPPLPILFNTFRFQYLAKYLYMRLWVHHCHPLVSSTTARYQPILEPCKVLENTALSQFRKQIVLLTKIYEIFHLGKHMKAIALRSTFKPLPWSKLNSACNKSEQSSNCGNKSGHRQRTKRADIVSQPKATCFFCIPKSKSGTISECCC